MARKSLFKRIVFQLHLWGGLAIGIYAVLIGITGSVLVFREEIVPRLSPVPRIASPATPPSLDAIRAGIQAHYPDRYPWSLENPAEPGEPWGSWVQRPGGGQMVFADAEGRVVGAVDVEGTWFQLFEQFHSFLLIPKGRLYNGIAGLILAGLSISGMVLWWPSRGEWHEAFRIVRRSNWKGITFDLHRVGGAVTFLFVVLFCITGAYFTWPAAYRTIAAAMFPTAPIAGAPRIEPNGARLSLDELVASAQRAVPDTTLVRVLVPRAPAQPVTVVLAHGSTHADRMVRTSQLQMHPYTGEVVSLDDYRQRRAGDHIIEWMGPLHTGHFGGIGVKTAWAAAGLVLPALFVTGFIMWCNRVLAPRLRRR